MIRFTPVLLLLALCIACGGGGSSPTAPPSAPPAPVTPKTYLDPMNLQVGQVGHFRDGLQWVESGNGDINFLSLATFTDKKIVTVSVPRKRAVKLESDVLMDSRSYVLPGEWKVTSESEFEPKARPKFDLWPNH